MRIAIIGTGKVGRVLGRRWAEGGHDVTFGTRRPDDTSLREMASKFGTGIADASEAASAADVVVLAVPGNVVAEIVQDLVPLEGKIVVDCTNPVGQDRSLRFQHSTAEQIALAAPSAHVVKAFNTTGAKNMADPVYPNGRLVMPICGDDLDAKNVVAQLASELEFEPLDNGPLRQARALEAMAFMWINQAYGQGWGPDFGFALFRRS